MPAVRASVVVAAASRQAGAVAGGLAGVGVKVRRGAGDHAGGHPDADVAPVRGGDVVAHLQRGDAAEAGPRDSTSLSARSQMPPNGLKGTDLEQKGDCAPPSRSLQRVVVRVLGRS